MSIELITHLSETNPTIYQQIANAFNLESSQVKKAIAEGQLLVISRQENTLKLGFNEPVKPCPSTFAGSRWKTAIIPLLHRP
jgi:hypothetical protein